jgi:(R)-citramalate synthase
MFVDTLGVLSQKEVRISVLRILEKFPRKHFDFHAHNDYGLAVANSLEAISCGCTGVHTTVNGLGERTGNAPIEQLVPVINDFLNVKNNVDESKLVSISRLVELFSRRRISKNNPIVGEVVFTQTAGIHADGDKKGKLYVSKLSPKRFGRETSYALGKLSGKASIELALKNFGINLEKDELKLVLEKVVELGDKKQMVTKEDLLFIIDEIQKNGLKKNFCINDFKIVSEKGKKPVARISVSFFGKKYFASAKGDGGYNAFINALKKVFKKKCLSFPKLKDYDVRIPIGGRTDAIVETKIVWKRGKRILETIGVSTDQLEAAIKSTEKMVNIILKLDK